MILFISFVTRPDRGSEGGVGWKFLKAHAEHSLRSGKELIALIDKRDECAVMRAVASEPHMSHVRIVAVDAPKRLQFLWNDRRTRLSYIGWFLRARRRARQLVADLPIEVVHQATFATASLPPVLPRSVPTRIWGPVAIPESVVERKVGKRTLETIVIYLLRLHARLLSRSASVLIAQNSFTFDCLTNWGRVVILEPNIVVSVEDVDESRCPDTPYFVLCGVLSERKRPWIALEAYCAEEFNGTQLLVVGSGPLETDLRAKYAQTLRGHGKVHFLGNVPHPVAMGLLKNANALLHPAKREGAPWVVGEAVTFGTPVVLLGQSGASAVLRLSNGEGRVADDGGPLASQVAGFRRAMTTYIQGRPPDTAPVRNLRWSESRLQAVLDVVVDSASTPAAAASQDGDENSP